MSGGANDLGVLIASHYSLVVAQVGDESRFLSIVRNAAGSDNVPVWTWSSAQGLARDGNPPQYQTTDLVRALLFLGDVPEPGVFVFEDIGPLLQGTDAARAVRMLKELAEAKRPGQTFVLEVAEMKIPAEVQGIAIPWTMPPPGSDELHAEVRQTLSSIESSGVTVGFDDAGVDSLVEAVRGLSSVQADQAIRSAALGKSAFGPADLAAVRNAKAEMVGDDGVLEVVDASGTLDDVGGLAHLKDWLKTREVAFQPGASDFGLDPPKGVLLAGIPGCGKSLVAKTIAHAWSMPLVLLDPGRLYGPYVGQSEQRLNDALKTVTTMAPAVMWIDEIEKGFPANSGGSADGGVSERILGTFLRWMEDRTALVFVVATCNDESKLPAELLRKGRFDEIFFVDLPAEPEREQIFSVQLRNRKRDPSKFDLAKLAAATDGFTGSEIEAAVVGALYRAFAAHRDLSTDDILAEVSSTQPLSKTRAEDIERLRDWAKGRAVVA
jgi:AAA+ superfamily predicted ATPase